MIVSPPFYVCDDEDCRAIARANRLDAYKILFTEFDPQTAYDELLDETYAALAHMHHRRLRREAMKAAPFICSHETPAQLFWYKRRLLEVFHQHGCLTFLKSVPRKPRDVFKPRFWLTIEDDTGGLITDVCFDSMMSYADVFGIPRKSLYRTAELKSRRSKSTRQYSVCTDIMKGQDPLTTSEGQALLKKVQSDPLTRDSPSIVQENSVRFYLSGLLDEKKKPLTGSQRRAEKRMLERRAQTFSGAPIPEDAQDEQSGQHDEPTADRQVSAAPTPGVDDGHDDPGP